MFYHQIKYEWLQLIRDKWVLTLLVVFPALCLFAVSNGAMKVQVRNAEIKTNLEVMASEDEVHKANIDSLERGLKTVEPWLDPRRLNFIGNRAPRVAAMPSKSIALISTGQSDLFAHSIKPTLYDESYMLSFTELSNPVQLMFGSFDLSFVTLYLLPLLVLAFSYNLVSAEREQGSLRVTFAQPINSFSWLLNKVSVRFFIIMTIVGAAIPVSMAFAGVPVFQHVADLLLLFALITLYVLFWFIISAIVNAFGKSSATNAITVISIWIILVLLLPAVISQLANSFYPVPSRINMIHEMRVAKAEAEKEADKILINYYRDHPELAQRDTTVKNQYAFYLRYFASQDVVKKAIYPVLSQYEDKLSRQQKFAELFRYASPSLLLQNAMNDLAGTSPRHYASYRNQVKAFAEKWRAYFLPRMFNNEWMRKEDFDKLPVFSFEYEKVPSSAAHDFTGLLFFVLAGLSVGAFVYRNTATKVFFAS